MIFYPFFVTRLRRGSFPRLKLLENRSLAGSLGLFGLMPAALVAARRFLTAGLCRAGLAGGSGDRTTARRRSPCHRFPEHHHLRSAFSAKGKDVEERDQCQQASGWILGAFH